MSNSNCLLWYFAIVAHRNWPAFDLYSYQNIGWSYACQLCYLDSPASCCLGEPYCADSRALDLSWSGCSARTCSFCARCWVFCFDCSSLPPPELMSVWHETGLQLVHSFWFGASCQGSEDATGCERACLCCLRWYASRTGQAAVYTGLHSSDGAS